MNDLLYVLKFFGSLPFWLRFLLYLLISGIIVAIAGYWGKHAAIIAAIVCLVLGILMLVLSRLSQWVRERKAAELRGEGLDFGVPSTLVDTDLLERLSNLRREFGNGIHKFQVFGKDLYAMPWYIMIGEHGAGKTEAVLHSKVDLPRDLQNQPQESIGSAHLNWWFTNYGVLLDTSGDMIFRADDTSVTPDWTEFLELLKKHRENCPSNGVIIAIPADSLINDSPKEIDRKAGIVARHLDKLQGSFKVKLPVYVLVTKCDLLEGFLPYFDVLKDPKLQQQMLGWSNPAPLEAPFRPEIFEDFIHSVIGRIRRMRLNLLSSPMPQEGMPRRADEVDELYGLPDSMLKIVAPLRSFLQDIFVPRQWAMSPLFLRGVYFTSACPLQNTPESGVSASAVPAELEKETEVSWYNKTSYFLRDVFLAKIFREDGLVTISGTEYQKNLRFRSIIFLICVAFLALMIFQLGTNYVALAKNITPQLPYWNRAAAGWDKKGYFSPIVVPDGILSSAYSYTGDKPIGLGPLNSKLRDVEAIGNYSNFGFLEKIALLSATLPPESYFRFHPLASLIYSVNKSRYAAQRVIFEGSVVRPLLEATRVKMVGTASPNASSYVPTNASTANNVQTGEAKALLELINLESGVIQRGEGQTNTIPGITFIPSLLEYVCRTNSADLAALMNWTYGVNPMGRNAWPPDWISGGNSLESNKAINAGIQDLIKGGQGELDLFGKNIAMIQKLADAANAYSEAESKLFTVGLSTNASPVANEEMNTKNAIENLESAKVALEQNIHLVQASGLFGTGPQTLLSAVNRLKEGNESYFGVINNIMGVINQILPAAVQTNQVSSVTSLANQAGSSSVPGASSVGSTLQTATNLASLLPTEESKKYQLFHQIQQKLSAITGKLSQQFASAMSDKQIAWYKTLDQNILEPYDNKPSYRWRWDLYKLCESPATGLEFNENMYLVGQQWYQVGQLIASLNGLYNSAAGYTGPFSNQVEVTCSALLQRFKDKQVKLFVQNYVKQAKDALRRVARFPLVYPPGPDDQALDFNQLVAAKGLLDAISQDLQSSIFTSLSKIEQQPALDFAMKIAPLYNVVDSLVLPNGTPARLSVTLFNGQAQKQLSGPNYAPLPTPTPTPTPPPRSAMSKLFFDIGAPPPPPTPPTAEVVSTSNWNAIQLVGEGGGGVFPLDSPTDVTLGTFSVQAPFSFAVFHSLISTDGAQTVDGGGNWSALRLIAKLGGTRVGIGQDWRVALMPDQSHGVWVRFSFELPMPPTPWPTVDSIGLRSLSSQ
jgi:hypothetical protein